MNQEILKSCDFTASVLALCLWFSLEVAFHSYQVLGVP